MAHFSKVGMRSPATRFWVAMVHLVLIIGSISMIVPFMIMLSTSFSSNVDSQDFRILPAYWFDDEALYRKYAESAFNEDITLYNRYTHNDAVDFQRLKQPRAMSDAEFSDFNAFKAALPDNMLICAHAWSLARPKTGMEGALRWQEFLAKRYNNDINKVNTAFEDVHEYFDHQVPVESWGDRRYQPADTPKFRDQRAFKKTLPPRFLTPLGLDGTFADYVAKHFDVTKDTLSKRYGPAVKSFADIHLARSLPAESQMAKDWTEYVCSDDGIGLPYVIADPKAAPAWRAFLKQRYAGSITNYNKHAFGDNTARYVAGFGAIPFYERVPNEDTLASDWAAWLKETRPAAFLRLDTPEFRYRDFLQAKYRSIAALNKAYGTAFAGFDAILLPFDAANWRYLQAEKSAIRREFAVRNYRDVFRYIALRGRALRNTVILVLGTILITLTINPMAAYALSRFGLKRTQQILLFLLATMAFPAEVSAIPGFLLLKQLHFLNTFWALLLPGMANGFSIFLLKGFFDSLPQEIFEAADLDGAGPLTIFARLVMPMSTPILAVIALGAFNGAYGSFMWAFVVCQDEKMWTLMVWLQQMSMWASQSMIFAALVIAALPTLIIFALMQKVIMQGVIIPMEK